MPLKEQLCVTFHGEDAWCQVVRPWLTQGLAACLRTSLPQVVVLPNDALIAYFKERALEEGIPLLGITWYTPGALRHCLKGALGIEARVALREDLHLLFASIPQEMGNAPRYVRYFLDDPSLFVKIYDLIVSSGMDKGVLGFPYLAEWADQLEQLLDLAGLCSSYSLDRKLLDRITYEGPVIFSRLLLYGFNISHAMLVPLLLAAIRVSKDSARHCLLYLGDALTDQVWLGTWEEFLRIPSEYLGESYQEQYGRFHNLALALQTQQPDVGGSFEGIDFIFAQSVSDEARMLFETVKAQLGQGAKRIGVIFPSEACGLSRELSFLFDQEDLCHKDRLGHLPCKEGHQLLLKAWIGYQRDPLVETASELLRALIGCGKLSPEVDSLFKSKVNKAFTLLLTNDFAILWAYLKMIFSDDLVSMLEPWLAPLPKKTSFLFYKKNFDRLLVLLPDVIEKDLYLERASVFEGLSLSPLAKEAFLHWVEGLFFACPRTVYPSGKHVFAKVQLLTLEMALGQTWDTLILAGLGEDAWSIRQSENIFLSEGTLTKHNTASIVQGSQGAGHLALRAGKAYILLEGDKQYLQRQMLAQLIASTSGNIFLSATFSGIAKEDGFTHDICMHLFWLTKREVLSKRHMEAIQAKVSAFLEGCAKPKLPEGAEVKEMLRAFYARRSLMPYSPYEYAFKDRLKNPLSLPCKAWEDVIQRPEMAWYKHILKINMGQNSSWGTGAKISRGTWVHSWLSRAGKNVFCGQLAPFCVQTWRRQVEQEAEDVKALVSQIYQEAASLNVPTHWHLFWKHSLQMAQSLVEQFLLIDLEAFEVAFEQALPEKYVKALGFSLRGQVDMLLKKGDNYRVLDFKTGGQEKITLKTIEKGSGLQLALYGQYFLDEGAKDVVLYVVHPDQPLQEGVRMDEGFDGLDAFYERIHSKAVFGVFGQRYSSTDPYAGGVIFPLATLPIDSAILRYKEALQGR